MKKSNFLYIILVFLTGIGSASGQDRAQNPVIYADVPDVSMIRVKDTWYMSSTTMHMSPGVPVMKSNDLVNWELVSYCYQTLDDTEGLNLENGKNEYGRGSWASCIRHARGKYYVSTFSGSTNTTYIYSTTAIESGHWEVKRFKPSYHDHTLFFDDDGKVYMLWGAGRIMMVELNDDLSGVKRETERVVIENASNPAGGNIMLQAEGSQLFKVNGWYYLFNIAWPHEGMRTVIIHRAKKITGPWEGRVALRDRGIAQGGLIDTPQGGWYAYLFRDYGAVGRIPYLVPVKWEDGWPVLGEGGKVPNVLDLPAGRGLIPGIVASDEFRRKANEPDLPLIWQWNHNPDNELWSVNRKKGYLRLQTGRVDNDLLTARNTLTQRTIGPECTGSTSIDVSGMKEGDFAGLVLLQKKYAFAGVACRNGRKEVIMVSARGDTSTVAESRLPEQEKVYLKAECDFRDLIDTAEFFYSLDGNNWLPIGTQLKMEYTLPHFMGYRFGLFNYATKSAGGYVDFDYFRIENHL